MPAVKKEEQQDPLLKRFWDRFFETEVDEEESIHIVNISRAIKILVIVYLVRWRESH